MPRDNIFYHPVMHSFDDAGILGYVSFQYKWTYIPKGKSEVRKVQVLGPSFKQAEDRFNKLLAHWNRISPDWKYETYP